MNKDRIMSAEIDDNQEQIPKNYLYEFFYDEVDSNDDDITFVTRVITDKDPSPIMSEKYINVKLIANALAKSSTGQLGGSVLKEIMSGTNIFVDENKKAEYEIVENINKNIDGIYIKKGDGVMSYTIEALRCLFVHAATNMLKENDIVIGLSTMADIIGTKMDDEFSDGTAYDPESPYMDTCVKDRVFDLVCNNYLGHPWPLYRDEFDMDEFYERLFDAIRG